MEMDGMCNSHVGDTSELLEQVPWKESDDGVLGGYDLICWVYPFLLDLALRIGRVRREILVDVYGAPEERSRPPSEDILNLPVDETGEEVVALLGTAPWDGLSAGWCHYKLSAKIETRAGCRVEGVAEMPAERLLVVHVVEAGESCSRGGWSVEGRRDGLKWNGRH